MIKCANDKILAQITKFFNGILDSGISPKTWSHGLFVQIFKMTKENSASYRDVTINNIFSKLFGVRIQKRFREKKRFVPVTSSISRKP